MFVFGGTFESENPTLCREAIIKPLTEEDNKMFEFLKDYKPEAVTDGFEVLKGTFNCNFNYARIEEYKGDKPEFDGAKFFRYELQICDGQNKAGRKFWKSVNLNDEAKVKKLADAIWTVTGYDFKDEETLLKAAEQLVTFTVEVKAWGFKPKEVKEGDDGSPIQMHIIKGKAKDKGTSAKSEVPF